MALESCITRMVTSMRGPGNRTLSQVQMLATSMPTVTDLMDKQSRVSLKVKDNYIFSIRVLTKDNLLKVNFVVRDV